MSRKNLQPNPRPASNTGYAFSGLGQVVQGDGWARLTTTATATTLVSTTPYTADAMPVGGRTSVEISLDVRAPTMAVRTRLAVYQYDASGEVSSGRVFGEYADLAIGEERRLTLTVTPVGVNSGLRVMLYVYNFGATTFSPGNVLDWRHLLVGDPGPYFDGSLPATTAWLYSWLGLPNASASLETSTMQLALVGTGAPQDVQVVIPGLTAGQVYLVEGTAAGSVWPVRGGRGTSNGSQLVLSDSRTPINVPVTYRVTVGGVVVRQSEPITVPFPEKYVLQSLDGQATAEVAPMSNGLPRSPEPRVSSYSIPGRTRPVVRYDVPGDGGGSLLVDTTGEQTPALAELLSTGRPIVIRTDGDVRDFPAVEILLITRFPSELTDARIQAGDTRRWTLEYLLIDDPDPDAVLPSSTWDDFDAVNAGFTWDDFDLQWVGADWDAFDRFDWEGQA